MQCGQIFSLHMQPLTVFAAMHHAGMGMLKQPNPIAICTTAAQGLSMLRSYVRMHPS